MKDVLYSCGEVEITKREAIFSVVIVIVMLCLGIFFSDAIKSNIDDKNDLYYSAQSIDNNASMFKYAMKTDYGNAFVHGDMAAEDPVSYDGVKGKYIYESWVKEEYTEHTRVVSTGKTSHVETYYSWDETDNGSKHCSKVTFCGSEFPYEKFDYPGEKMITTIYKTSDIRYTYYGVADKSSGSIFAKLSKGTIPDRTNYYDNMSNEELLKNLVNRGTGWLIFFWVMWLILTAALVYGFYSIDNRWLEDN